MKKTTITIATMSLILMLAATAFGQPRRRAPQQVGNPFGLGGTVTAGVKNRKPMNLGDTGTHEVGHKGNRRATPKGWSLGASNPTIVNNQSTSENSQNNRTRASQPKQMKLGDIKGEVINSQQPNAAKYDGIDGESNDARTKSPNSGASPAGIAMATEVAAKDIRKQSNKRRNGQFRPNPTGDGTTQQFRKTNTNGQNNRSRNPQTTDSYLKIEGIDGEGLKRPQANGIKFEGIDGESNDARTKQPNGQRNINVNRTETVDNNEYRAKRPASVKGQTEYVDNDEYKTKRPNRRKR